jgi:hypothetical protein
LSRRQITWPNLEPRQKTLVQRAQMPGSVTNPIRQRRAIQINALAGVNLSLPVQRQMVGIFGHQNLRNGRFRWQATFDQPCLRRSLKDTFLAAPTRIFWPSRHENPELRRHHIQPLALVLANPVQFALAARTGLVVDIDDNLDPRQMRRQ